MKHYFVILIMTLFLTACPGGLRTVMVSTYSLEPQNQDAIFFHEGYLDEYARPSVKIDDVLYIQMRSDNYDDLGIETPLSNKYSIEVWLSTDKGDVWMDVSSFTLQRQNNNTPLEPMIFTTHKRAVVTEYDREPYTVCDFPYANAQEAEGLVSVPLFGDSFWPPESYDDTVLCMRLVFEVPISEVPPQKQFQLSFRYFIGEQPKDVTLYFYPFKYTVFRH